MAAGDLTSLANVRAFLQKQGSDQAQDAVINSLITRVSAAIKAYARREFTTTDATLRKFVYSPNKLGLLDLDPYDLRNITLVRIDTDGTAPTPQTLTADAYRLQPRNKNEGVWTSLRLFYTYRGGLIWGERELEITGDWGFPTVPPDVEEACIETVAAWLRRDVAAFETTFILDEGRLDRPEGIPAGARSKLLPYRRAI